ncbi:OMP85 family outer membrane protein [Formosimonas limnophila]|uniref:OMP85 family outer membrane protein n=1 Tax=Formosimonas limnophila TaxID=1384487 RepID=A0A8J3G0V4_9BURK|nr:patatin-like phospholipase family protein [Formosimonas limnophila]GHA76719.1 OMP85 family outer membrane protein [Formosimonas limnophila]
MAWHVFHLNKTTVIGLLLISVWAVTPLAFAQETSGTAPTNTQNTSASAPKSTPTKGREKVGLVLSGGGARGLAHLGVLRALEKQHVPIDYIAGTSAGALIGGMYASGMSVDEIENRIKDVDLQAISFATQDRRYLPQNTRNLEYSSNTAVDVSISEGGKVTLPIAVSSGTQVEQLLRDILRDKPYDVDFDKLPIPFRAVASDLSTGQMVVLKQGQLVQALRASMSIPGVFAPVEKDGVLLVDGMVARNLPVDVARQMGATRIIAVDVGSELHTKEELNSVVSVSEQLLSLLVKRNVEEQVASLTKNDLLIRPALGKLSNLDFKAGKEAPAIGEAAMQTPVIKHQLASLAVSPAAYTAYTNRHVNQPAAKIPVDYVRVETNGLASPATLESQLAMKNGATFDIDTVNQDIQTLMTSGRISVVRYQVNRVGDKTELVYQVTEKDGASNALRAGIEVQGDSPTNQQFSLHLSHHKVWLNKLGGEWRNQLILGKKTTLISEINQPFSSSTSLFIRPQVKIAYEKLPVYSTQGSDSASDTKGQDLASEYRRTRKEIGFLIGSPIKRIGEWGIGVSRRHVYVSGNDANPDVIIPSVGVWRTTLDTKLTIDQLDDLSLPTKGYFLRAYANISPQTTQGHRFWQSGLQTLWAASKNSHSINLRFEAAGSNNDESVYLSPYNLGGYQRLSGYSPDQFIGNYMMLTNATYRYRTKWSLLGNSLYLGASLEAGNTWDSHHDIKAGSLRYSGSVFGALNTPIGPAQIGVGLSAKGNARFYFSLGRTFSETP